MKDPLLVRNDDPPAPLPTVEFPRRVPEPAASAPVPATSPAPVVATAPAPTRPAPPSLLFGPSFTQALLIVCILMLGVVIGMKLSDSLHGRTLEQRELALLRAGQSGWETPPGPAPAMVPQVSTPAAAVAAPPVPGPEPAPAQPVAPPAPPAAPSTPDYSDQLSALQQERDLMRQRFESLSGAAPGTPGADSAPPPPESFLPPAPGTTAKAPSSFVPSRTTLSPAQQRIRDAPSLGKVMEYDADWHFVVISCGANHNLTQNQQLAIRRGHEILGLVRLDEVLPDQSVAELDGSWKVDPQAPKPQLGDDVLTYPPF
jgi:hypothetical protein